jgi:hypothetical protein
MTCPFRFQLILSVRSSFSRLLLAERSLEHNGFYNSASSAEFYICTVYLNCIVGVSKNMVFGFVLDLLVYTPET